MTQLALLSGANDLAGTMFTDDVTGDAGASGSDYLDPKGHGADRHGYRADAQAADDALRNGLTPANPLNG